MNSLKVATAVSKDPQLSYPITMLKFTYATTFTTLKSVK